MRDFFSRSVSVNINVFLTFINGFLWNFDSSYSVWPDLGESRFFYFRFDALDLRKYRYSQSPLGSSRDSFSRFSSCPDPGPKPNSLSPEKKVGLIFSVSIPEARQGTKSVPVTTLATVHWIYALWKRLWKTFVHFREIYICAVSFFLLFAFGRECSSSYSVFLPQKLFEFLMEKTMGEWRTSPTGKIQKWALPKKYLIWLAKLIHVACRMEFSFLIGEQLLGTSKTN